MGGWFGVCEKGEGITKYKLAVTEYHRDLEYSLGNIVNNVDITMYVARWVLDPLRGSLSKLYECLTTMLDT